MRDSFIAPILEKHLADWNEYYPRDYLYPVPRFVGVVGVHTTGTQFQQILNIQQDWPFVIEGISVNLWNADFENLAAGTSTPIYDPTGTIADIDLQIFDSGASAFLSSDFVPLRVYGGGNGRDRYCLPVPYMVDKNTNLTFTLNSRDTRTFNVVIVLHGYKIVKRTHPIKPPHHKMIEDFHAMHPTQQQAVVAKVVQSHPAVAANVIKK
jgi:hypothetical protein